MPTIIDDSILQRVVALSLQVQQIPAPTNREKRRADFIHRLFEQEGLRRVSFDEAGNVLACIPGNSGGKPVVVTAHLDTVFPIETPLHGTHKADILSAPSIGDNSLGVAALCGLKWQLETNPKNITFPGDLWLVANVGEEGLGNLRGMRAVVDRFGASPSAYVILEGLGLGQIFHRALEVQRFRISVKTPGGHSWVDYGRPSAIHEIGRLITRLADITVPVRPRTTLNVGTINGGTSINAIASEASLELDLRSESPSTLRSLVKHVEQTVQRSNSSEVAIFAEKIGHRPGGRISANHPLVRLAQRCLRDQGIQPNLSVGSTDANVPLSLKLPGICIGLTHGGEAHTVNEYIQIAPISQGLGVLVDLVAGAFTEL